MIRMILAAAAALALVSAAPAFACPDCHDCPNHKDKVAANDTGDKAATTDKKPGEKGDKKVAVDCPCHKEGGPCKCGDKCHCAGAKAQTKTEKKS